MPIAIDPTEECKELGRVTRNHVSAYQRDRIHYGQLYAGERRCLVTNFNGAIPKSRSIISATWRTDDTMTCRMSDAGVSGREVKVMIGAQYSGRCRVLVEATLDNGDVYSAWHVIRVMPAPYFGGENWTNGPNRLEAVA